MQIMDNNYKSQFVGVTYHSGAKKWRSRISQNGKSIYLGVFDTQEEANQARLAGLIHMYETQAGAPKTHNDQG